MNSIVKTDCLLQVVFAELYAPDIVDSQRDFMTRDEIRKSCWGFMKSGRNEIDVEHDGVVTTCAVVESFIARDDDPVFVPDGDNRTLAEYTDSEKNAISHRGNAFRALEPVLRELLS